jgi:alpha-beta hydrolase superfamily lysophospholipase
LRPTLNRLIQELPALDIQHPSAISPDGQAYLEYYRLTFPDLEYTHTFGTFQSNGFTLAAHLYQPPQAKGTVFILHGYLDHAGIVAPLIRYCLEQQQAVAMYDLPGHGLSDGARASIERFTDYIGVFRDFLALCTPHVPKPFHLFSHSTGGAISLEYLAHTAHSPFDKVVFLAPLVRHVYWHPAKATYAVGKLFAIKTVPRRSSGLSSNPDFLEFFAQDPLMTARVPTQWIGALYAWEEDIRTIAPLSHPVLIIQGTRDTVVDGDHNVPFLQQKFTHATVKWIQDGRHQLVNERDDIQQHVFDIITSYLHT